MKKLFLVIAISLCVVSYASATAYESITVSSAAIGPTASKIANAPKSAYCTVESYSIRFTTDGTTPTSSVGFLVAAGSDFIITNATDLAALKMIRVTSDATVQCEYFVDSKVGVLLTSH